MSGQIYGFNQVFDANGNPLPGALLYTYVPSTTTPKATYTDATLAVPLSNPIVADSAGRFPQIFADEGEIYDLVLKSATFTTIDSYYTVTALGASSGDINIDFGLNGRFRVVGNGGEPNIEFGDPTGDDVGGDGRIGGWNNTQGTALEIDFAQTEFTGSIVYGGVTNPFPALLLTGTFSAVSALNLVLNQSYSSWELRLSNIILSASNVVQSRLSFDGGGTYKSGAADYMYEGLWQNNAGATSSPVATADHMRLTGAGIAAAATAPSTIDIRISSNTGEETRLRSNFVSLSAVVADSISGQMGGGTNATAFGKATNIRVFLPAGTFSGRYSLIGLP